MTQSINKPWYRHPWVVVSVFIPAFTVVLCAALIVIAVKDKDPLVRDDWYMDGRALEQDLAKDSHASIFNVQASIQPAMQNHSWWVANVRFGQSPAIPKKIELSFVHPTNDAKDWTTTLSPTSTSSEYSQVDKPPFHCDAEHYYVELSTNEWRLRGKVSCPLNKTIVLTPLPIEATQSQP